jgi:DNA-binding beta-propeller fold protein YncE
MYVTVETGAADGGAIAVIDTATRKQVDRIEVGARGPHWFAITPDGAKGYATNKADPFISVIDLAERSLAGRIPAPYGTEEVTVSPDGHRAYAAGMALHRHDAHASTPATLLVIDTASDRVVAHAPWPLPDARCTSPRTAVS